MKTFLSLALACIMMLSVFALASCGNNATTNTNSTTTTKQDDTTRYTVTKGEWDAMWSSTNFTVKPAVEGEQNIIYKTETAMAVYVNGQPQFSFDIVGETVYMVVQDESGNWLGAEATDIEYSRVALGTLATSLDESLAEVYDDLTYNEADKAYTWADGEYSAKYQFENGALVIAEFWINESTVPATITNVGTTQVDVPEYTLFNGGGEEEGSDVSLSMEDWMAVWSTNNFTISYTEGDFEQVTEISSTKYKLTTWSDDGDIIYIYREIVNGIEYQIMENEDGAWYGVVAEPNLEEFTLSSLFGSPDLSELYNKLVYDEENDEYVISTEDSIARFTITSGMLVYVEITNTTYDTTTTVHSCGSTEFDIPEYTVIEE